MTSGQQIVPASSETVLYATWLRSNWSIHSPISKEVQNAKTNEEKFLPIDYAKGNLVRGDGSAVSGEKT